MANKTKIEWTKSVWNPIVGCSLVSPGCTHCYAMRDAWRKGFNPKTPMYHGLTKKVNGKPVWTGETRLAAHKLDEPLRRRTPDLIFVNSMSDLFHESVPDEWIDRVFAVMALAPQHTFQVLTKRSARMRAYFERLAREDPVSDGIAVLHRAAAPALGDAVTDEQWISMLGDDWPLPNVWLGVSVEDQARADERIPDLLATPAAVRWISAEPLLGAVDLSEIATHRTGDIEWTYDALRGPPDLEPGERIDWIVAGGESGPGARPMHPDWIRSLRDQCAAAGVPFFFKQWGAIAPGLNDLDSRSIYLTRDGMQVEEGDSGYSNSEVMCRVGKKAAGAELDGREHREWPNGRP